MVVGWGVLCVARGGMDVVWIHLFCEEKMDSPPLFHF